MWGRKIRDLEAEGCERNVLKGEGGTTKDRLGTPTNKLQVPHNFGEGLFCPETPCREVEGPSEGIRRSNARSVSAA